MESGQSRAVILGKWVRWTGVGHRCGFLKLEIFVSVVRISLRTSW